MANGVELRELWARCNASRLRHVRVSWEELERVLEPAELDALKAYDVRLRHDADVENPE